MKEQSENNFISKFEKRLSEVPNKEYLIQNEINQIEKTTSSDEPWQEFDNEPWRESEKHSVFRLEQVGSLLLFNDIFHFYLLNNECDSILGEGMKEDDSIMATVEEAMQFADYYTWLKSLKNVPSKPKTKSQLSHKEKMLALHYLGLDLSKYDNTKAGEVLGEILGMDKGNTRQYLSYVRAGKNEVRTLDNLRDVLQLFEDPIFKDISSAIKSDIDSLS
ncbi:hypothetical protein [Flagellimonas sp.]|uniref:hypothetical protein n=1 Tax=Flagellimonas sp. TaxID=2058762 RepID=UPI003BA9B138